MNKTRFSTQIIQEFPTYILYGKFDGDKLMYKECVQKPPPSKETNKAIIKAQEVKYAPFTDQEKKECKIRGSGKKKKFTDATIKNIRKKHAKGESIGNLAKHYFVTKATIQSIVTRKSYRHIE